MRSILVALGVSAVLCTGFLLAVYGAKNWHDQRIGFMRLEVVNDTQRAVKVQPCWDLDCYDTIGLHSSTLRPGDSRRVAGQWANNRPQRISVAILSPHATEMDYDGCVISSFPPGTKKGIVHVSRMGDCPTGPEGGFGGGGG
jgi:hypothetical protein